MSSILLLLTAAVIVLSSMYAWRQSRDPLHPLPLIGSMFIYMYVLRPFLLLRSDTLPDILTSDQVNFGLLINFLNVSGFCIGCTIGCRRLDRRQISLTMDPGSRDRVHSLGVLLGIIGTCGYVAGLIASGGLANVYSRAKGHIVTSTGYLGELPLLCFPAIMLVMLARRGRVIRGMDWFLALTFAAPQLIHGILGARRGPTFLVLATLFLSWFVASGRRPRLIPLVISLTIAAGLIFFVISHRSQIYLGSELEVDTSRIFETAFPLVARPDDDVVFAWGQTNIARMTDRHYWGTRLMAVLFVRPIPRQMWPTKYEDTGFGWMVSAGNLNGYWYHEWIQHLGWRPAGGSSGGFSADLFVEFSWGCAIAALVMGGAFAYLWRRASIRSGIWTILFLEAMILSVYIPTQTVSALLYRFMFMSVLTLVLWIIIVGRVETGQTRTRSASLPAAPR